MCSLACFPVTGGEVTRSPPPRQSAGHSLFCNNAGSGRSKSPRRWLGLFFGVALLGLLLARVVIAAPPTADFTISDSTPETGQPVTFTSKASDPDDDIATIEWDFDYDSATQVFTVDSTDTNPSNTYDVPGDYLIAMRVTDGTGTDGMADTDVIVKGVNVIAANRVPVADALTWTPQGEAAAAVPDAGQRVTFSGAGRDPDADPITYEWDFGDGGTATGRNPSHVFGEGGAYDVTLRVRDDRGGLSAPHTERVVVNALPQASFTTSPTSPQAGEVVTLSSTSADPDGPLATQRWDLDEDGQFDDAGTPVAFATYNRPGTHDVGLRVVDAHGATSTAVEKLTVRATQPPTPLGVLQGVHVRIAGSLTKRGHTRIKRLFVRAPRGARIVVRCRDRTGSRARGRRRSSSSARLGCKARNVRRTASGRPIRFRRLEGVFRAGTRITVAVERDGVIGRYTRFSLRRGRPPARIDRCLQPGTRGPGRCPTP
jgi:PKD repeat protein